MADRGLHTLGDDRSVAERYFWLWIALAFVVGLVPGVVGILGYRNATSSYNTHLVELRNTASAQNDKLTAENKRLQSEVASAQVAVADTASSQTGDSSSGTVPAPKPGDVAFVSRSISPSSAAPGATIKLTTVIAGKATDAYMQVQSQDRSYSKIWQLHKGKANGTATSWTRSDAVAPKTAGSFVVLSWALVGSKKSMMPGAGLLTVK